MCLGAPEPSSYKCVQVHQSPSAREGHYGGNCGHRDNAAGEKFPGAGQRQFRETFPFSVMLHPVDGGMPVVRLTML